MSMNINFPEWMKRFCELCTVSDNSNKLMKRNIKFYYDCYKDGKTPYDVAKECEEVEIDPDKVIEVDPHFGPAF